MEKDLDDSNKREQNRISLEVPLKYQRIDAKGNLAEEEHSRTKDISKAGLLFKTKKVCSLGEKIKIVLLLPGIKHPIHILGKIVRVEEIGLNEEYNIGVVFLEFEDEDKSLIITHIEHMDVMRLLKIVQEENASDLHLTYGLPPMLRIYKKLKPIEDMQPLTKEGLEKMIYSIMSEEQIKRFKEEKDINFAFSPYPEFRFRVNVHYQRGAIEAAFRTIPPQISSLRKLGLPSIIEEFTNLKKGIVIISGTTGSGKTTTLSAMIDLINRNRETVVICLEHPIEYVHTNIKSIIKQREIGVDTLSFASGLRNALRQDPDIILVGEMRDAETIQTALIAAETGHLVLSSLHASNSIDAIDRIINVFPAEQQKQVCSQLSHCLQGIVTQLLLPGMYQTDVVLATEILKVTSGARNIIRERNLSQIDSILQTGSHYGMHTIDSSIKSLLEEGKITKEVALEYTEEFNK
ncbi:MAG: PilT/PilU family type 4a pilus ATPase [Candidatus Omnitrophica bacterium]|nr:PilT/PilU family type 4a pilus ATPase [Candidatus Omnitrophota bacterium]